MSRPATLTVIRRMVNRGTLRLLKKAVETRFVRPQPFILSHLATNRCNVDCETCLWKTPANTKADELSTEEIGDLYDQAARLGFLGVTVWGGEPTLRPDIGEILRRALAAKIEPTLITNGFSLAKRGKEYLPYTRRLCVSIDGDREQHDRTRRCPGLYDRILEGLEVVRRDFPRVRIVIGCVITRQNVNQLEHVAEIARRFGARVIYHVMQAFDYAAWPRIELDLPKLALSADEERDLYRRLASLAREDHVILNLPDFFETLAEGPPSFSCHYRKVVFRVEANGDVRDCAEKDRYVGSIRQMPLAEMIRGPYQDCMRRAESCSLCPTPAVVTISRLLEGRPATVRDALERGVVGGLG
jgi:MoaA/NifB/PqqE/SkfB family radical SAM enzyme